MRSCVQVQRNACGALRNVIYGRNNVEGKILLRNCGGIMSLCHLLEFSDDIQVKELVTGECLCVSFLLAFRTPNCFLWLFLKSRRFIEFTLWFQRILKDTLTAFNFQNLRNRVLRVVPGLPPAG